MSKLWSYSDGEYGAVIRVYERTPGGPIYIREPDGFGGYERRSLGHRDRDRAKQQAKETALTYMAGSARSGGVPNLRTVLELYHQHRISRFKATTIRRRENQRTFWLALLGGDCSPLEITRERWNRARELRLSGAVNHLGGPVPEAEREPCRPVTVNADLKYLKAAMKWAANWRVGGTGTLRYLLPGSPVKGFELLKQRKPRRPVATLKRFRALRDCGHTMLIHRNGHRVRLPSYFPEILDLCMGTNRRIMAIASLRYEDVVWRQSHADAEPYGAIVWPVRSDKMQEEWRTPMTPMVRAALLRTLEYRYVGGPDREWVFPAPEALEKHVSRGVLWNWLRDAEDLAGLDHQEGGGYHQFRRLWASRRRAAPEVDVARAGGWANVQTVRTYQQTDADAVFDTMLDPEVERCAVGPKLAQELTQGGEQTA